MENLEEDKNETNSSIQSTSTFCRLFVRCSNRISLYVCKTLATVDLNAHFRQIFTKKHTRKRRYEKKTNINYL